MHMVSAPWSEPLSEGVEQVPECRRFCRGRVVFRLEQIAGRHRGRLTALHLPLRFEERREAASSSSAALCTCVRTSSRLLACVCSRCVRASRAAARRPVVAARAECP
jgi:hypothetical protein